MAELVCPRCKHELARGARSLTCAQCGAAYALVGDVPVLVHEGLSEQELAFFLNIDFERHVALVAQIDEDGRAAIVGGGRYIMVAPDQAEIAFVVVDAYQSQGIGTILMRHLTILARKAAVKELVADVLPENTAMLKVFGKFGFRPASKRTFQIVHLALQLA